MRIAALALVLLVAPPALGETDPREPTAKRTGRAARAAQVVIDGFQFAPARLVVAPGTVVTFLNQDATPHTVTPVENGTFVGTGRLLSGEKKTVTFPRKGTFGYFCEFHTTMRGQVVVR